MSDSTIEQNYQSLLQLLYAKDITQLTFCKLVVQLAWDYCVQNNINGAVALLSALPDDYLMLELVKQAAEDSAFGAIALKLAKALHHHHKVLPNKEAQDVMYHYMVETNKIGKA